MTSNNNNYSKRSHDFKMSLFVFLCNEIVPVAIVQVLNTNPIFANPAYHSYVCNAYGESMTGVDWQTG